jgi:hypothetical protein
MPIGITGQCVAFDATEITNMEIETLGVRQQSHPTETRELGTNTMRREFLVAWVQRYNFIELCLGNCAIWDDSGTLKLSRLLPDDKYGRSPTNPEVIATKVDEMTGFGQCIGEDADGMPEYPQSRVKIFYEHVPFKLLLDADITTELDRYVIPPGLIEQQTEAEYTTMPGGFLHYIREDESGNPVGATPHMKPIPFNVGFVTPTQQRTVRWVNLPEDAWGPGSVLHERVFEGDGDDRPFIGTINKEAFVITGATGYPMGTMLFEAVKEKLYRSPLAEGWRWDLEFVFRYRPQGWNWLRYFAGDAVGADNGIYLAGKGDTHYFSDTLPDDYALYDARDHNKLFNPN